MKEKLASLWSMWQEIKAMPQININLMFESCQGNDPFYSRITQEYFDEATARHPKLPIIRKRQVGVAIYPFDESEGGYTKAVESSARRNYKKAVRNGYSFRRIDFNEHIDDVWDIRRSTKVRQGNMPESFINNRPAEVTVPESNSDTHDYPYFGIFNSDDKLVAYASGIVAGELMEVEHVYGHFDFQTDGIVPMLYISIAEHIKATYPNVKFYCYGTFLGASPTLKRFKKKFKFLPHKVQWQLASK